MFFQSLVFAQRLKNIKYHYDKDKKQLKESFYILKNTNQSVILDSVYVMYYQNGNYKTKGSYKNNVPVGLWQYYFESGSIKMKGNYENNFQTGEWQYFHENGNVSMQGYLDSNLRSDVWQMYYENGKLKSTGKYYKGKAEGIWFLYHEDGNYKGKVLYKSNQGFYQEFFPNGKLKTEGIIKDGMSDSLWTYYHENGKIKAQGNEKNGTKEGYWYFYHENGQVASEGAYVKGKTTGQWKYYHPNGFLSAEGYEENSNKEGYWKLYYETGSFKAEGTFKQGDGPYKEYYENGKLKINGYLKKGKNEGKWLYYYDEGSQEGECDFTNGNGEYIGYYPNGKLKMKGKIENGNKIGIWELFNEDGSLAGLYKNYYENNEFVLKPVEAKRDTIDFNLIGKNNTPKPKENEKSEKNKFFLKLFNLKRGEYRSAIVGVNPLAITLNTLPIYLEFYNQERLGLEFNYTLIRKPFFVQHQLSEPDKLFSNGYSASFKHKFYAKVKDNKGMRYFAYEIRYKNIDYKGTVSDTNLNGVEQKLLLQSKEKTYEVTALFGDRLMQHYDRDGFTFDIFLGIGIGYRDYSKNFDSNQDKNDLFQSIRKDKIYIPVRFGFSFGYAF